MKKSLIYSFFCLFCLAHSLKGAVIESPAIKRERYSREVIENAELVTRDASIKKFRAYKVVIDQLAKVVINQHASGLALCQSEKDDWGALLSQQEKELLTTRDKEKRKVSKVKKIQGKTRNKMSTYEVEQRQEIEKEQLAFYKGCVEFQKKNVRFSQSDD